jgi:hypothetical protein
MRHGVVELFWRCLCSGGCVFHGMELVGGGSTGRQAYVDNVLRLCCLPSFFGCEYVNMGLVRLRRLLLPAVCDIDPELHASSDLLLFFVFPLSISTSRPRGRCKSLCLKGVVRHPHVWDLELLHAPSHWCTAPWSTSIQRAVKTRSTLTSRARSRPASTLLCHC